VTGQPGTFELAALELGRTIGKASNRLSDDTALETFAELGVMFPPQLLANAGFNSARGMVVTAGERLASQVQDLETAIEGGQAADIVSAALALAVTIGQLIDGFAHLPGALQAAAPGLPGITVQQVNDFVADLPERLLDLLLYDAFDLVPVVGSVLEVFGVIEREFRPGDPANPTKPDFDRITIHLDRLFPAFMNPVAHLQSLYQWGDSNFDAAKLLAVLDGAIGRLGFPVLLRPASGADPVTLEAFAVDLRPTSSGSPPGLEFELVFPASIDRTFTFPVSPPTWIASVTAHAAVLARAQGTVRPPFDVEVNASGQLTASALASLAAQPPTPIILLGQPGGSRLELSGISLGGGAELTWDSGSGKATGGPLAQGSLTGGKLVIDASDGDGFINTLLSGVHLESTFAFQFAFAPETGLRFEGSGALEIQIPVHLSLGPIDVDSIYLVAGLANGTVPIELSAAIGAKLGPLGASVDRLGAIVMLSFPPGGGNVGPGQIDVAFKPPTGVGLSLDLAIITGGGFLSIDVPRGEYVGILQFEIAGFVGVTAIGLLNTKNPDGTPGFSLLIILTADFGPGIQLGFGFTLNAVGGLLGVNRIMLFDPLMQGVRTGAIDSIMFPQDVVANAPRIISDLRAIFPPHQGTFLVGPMAKLGWGEPTLVSLSLGVIIVIPPGDIAILGVLRLALPTEEADILRLQVNFAGALEFSKQRLYFFASLYDSHLLFITIQGEMGLLFAYGQDANFVLSVGGFHPRFNPPPLPFPTPQRIQLNIINESFARIRADAYFAVTTNTAQFGSHADMFFGFSALSVEGHSGFDALFQFSPFHFTVEISTSFSVKVFGVGVWGLGIDLTLQGPNPWHAHGTASISFFFFSIDVNVDFTWGDPRDTTLPPVTVMPIIARELAKRSNWKAQLPSGSNLLVSLRHLDPTEADLVLHPVGSLQISQRAVPLDLHLDKVGNQKPSDADQFALAVTSTGLSKTRNLTEPFAPAQFRDFDDAAKLSQPAYAPLDSGIELAPSGKAADSGAALTRIVRYDLHIVDTTLQPPQRHRFFVYSGALFQHWLGGASVAFSNLSAAKTKLTKPYPDAVAVTPETYAVANVADNTIVHSEAASFTSYAAASDYIDRTIAADPAQAGTLHVLPTFEVSA
jgi:Family of unknown function (DUF6603)